MPIWSKFRDLVHIKLENNGKINKQKIKTKFNNEISVFDLDNFSKNIEDS